MSSNKKTTSKLKQIKVKSFIFNGKDQTTSPTVARDTSSMSLKPVMFVLIHNFAS